MNVINTTWRQLVRRRLWPVALLLVAALAAVPVLLVQDPEVPAPPADLVPLASEPDDTIAEPVVAAVTPEDRARRRRVLGVRKDPFAPAPVKKAKVDEPKSEAPPKNDTGTGTEVPPVSVGGGGGGGTVPVPGEPAAPKKYYRAGTIVVRFGDATSDQLDRFAIEKLEPVPNDELPLLIYMGLTKDGKKAKFLVDASVEVDGDGTCKPHRSSCETIELSVGETEFLDVLDTEGTEAAEDEAAEDEAAEAEAPIVAQYQLDLVDIKRAGDDDVK
jgi:hypothetical protein